MSSKQESEFTSNTSRLAARRFREAIFIIAFAVLPLLALYTYARPKSDSHHTRPASSSGTVNLKQPNGHNAFVNPFEPDDQHASLGVPANALWIDARSAPEFAREHVPGALNLNETNWNEALVKLFQTWRRPRPIVVYCSFRCSSGTKVATKLKELGVEPVQVLEGGFERWKQSNS
jgi:rhodanese-related sulfurtransferase